MSFSQISKEVTEKKFSPVYYLFGEESYFIDKLSKQIETSVLNPGEETFNKAVLYGAEANAGKLLGELKSFPMMSTYRLVMLKEAQKMRKDEFEKLVNYLENPVASTVFVIAWKGKGLDGRSKASKLLKKNGKVLESKKIYENQVGPWIANYVRDRGYEVKPDALQVLVAYLGNNLGLIANELEKIFLSIKGTGSKEVSREVVYEMINIDKDFNVFELINAVGRKDHINSHLIISQMMKNVKDNPPILILFQLFQFFNKMGLVKSKGLKSDSQIASALKISPFIAREYVKAEKSYSQRQVYQNLVFILEADLFLKGIHSTHMSGEHVLKTLVFKLLG